MQRLALTTAILIALGAAAQAADVIKLGNLTQLSGALATPGSETKRGIDLVCLEVKDPEVNLARARQTVLLREGIDAETARKIQRAVKDSRLKVQAAIQGDKLRVSGKSRDELQAAIALLRQQKVDVALQFNNFRD